MMSDFEARIAIGNTLEREGKDDEAIAHFKALLDEYPDQPRAHFEYAGAFDSAGREAEAVPHYRRAMEMGLPEEILAQAYVQFGSTLRNIREYDEAARLLREGAARFPDHAAIRLFLALVLHSAGEDRAAVIDLLELAIQHIQTPDMQRYQRAIRYYVDEVK
jgi:tetratricopeptide (TPR) repeat protein